MSMAASGKEGFLRNHNVVTDVDVVLIVKPYAFTYPSRVPHMKLPRELNSGSGSEDNVVPDLSAEGP